MATFSALVGVVALFTGLLFPALMNAYLSREAIERARTVGAVIGYGLSAPVHFNDQRGVHEVLEAIQLDDDIRFLSVRDSSGGLIAERGTAVGPSAGFSEDGSTYVTMVPVMQGASTVGTLTIGLAFDELNDMRLRASRLGLAVGLMILVGGLLAVYAASRLLTRSLTTVVDTVRRIAGGDFALRAEEPRERELGELVGAFNHMVDKLVEAQADLARTNTDLEGRVTARTAQLQHALDVQDRVQGELAVSMAAARANAEMLQSFIDVAPQAILAVDLDWNVTRWNKAAEQLFGWSVDEVLGRPIPYIPEEERRNFQALQESARHGVTPAPREAVRRRKDGSLVTVLLAVSILRDAGQRAIGYIGVITDLTDRKALEDQLRQSQKMEAIGRLAGGIAHDFNNILTVITACASLLRDTEALDQSLRDDVEGILDAAMRAAALTRQLLTFSRKQVENFRPVDVEAIVSGMSAMLRRVLRENIDFRVLSQPSTGLILADPMQIEQVIMNLAVNAADAMEDGGQLAIETSAVTLAGTHAELRGVSPGSYRTLIVRDTGIGMDKETVSRIFEPFFTTKAIGHGTGLGLATTYAIVDQLKGHIDVQSAPGKGTTFTIYIPIAAANADPVAEPGERNRSPLRGSETILLVEDEESVRTVLRRTLQKAGYTVLEAPDGEAALAVTEAKGSAISLVVTDMMMPRMNGRQFAEQLSQTLPKLRVIFMSGYADDAVRGAGGLTDATHAYLQKPFTKEDLLVAVRSMLDGVRLAA